jgi:hypothetical protein
MFVDEMKHVVIRQISPYLPDLEFFSIYGREMELASMGNQSIEETVKKIVKQVNNRIAENINQAR